MPGNGQVPPFPDTAGTASLSPPVCDLKLVETALVALEGLLVLAVVAAVDAPAPAC